MKDEQTKLRQEDHVIDECATATLTTRGSWFRFLEVVTTRTTWSCTLFFPVVYQIALQYRLFVFIHVSASWL